MLSQKPYMKEVLCNLVDLKAVGHQFMSTDRLSGLFREKRSWVLHHEIMPFKELSTSLKRFTFIAFRGTKALQVGDSIILRLMDVLQHDSPPKISQFNPMPVPSSSLSVVCWIRRKILLGFL